MPKITNKKNGNVYEVSQEAFDQIMANPRTAVVYDVEKIKKPRELNIRKPVAAVREEVIKAEKQEKGNVKKAHKTDEKID